MVDNYKVSSGDSLWTISAKPAIYSNPYQWPLIYKTNKRAIRDPDLIRPGQVLNIDREASQVEINAAVTHARSRGAWSLGEKEVFDQAY
ncbi:MAG: LysM peptidoglycan-binding domain-containing protein, partial [Gammaproteobacteria bacterium]|nr:LysM peptidoglycan-binding domain-containing protein [Gammaproteobacteria bacterium]